MQASHQTKVPYTMHEEPANMMMIALTVGLGRLNDAYHRTVGIPTVPHAHAARLCAEQLHPYNAPKARR